MASSPTHDRENSAIHIIFRGNAETEAKALGKSLGTIPGGATVSGDSQPWALGMGLILVTFVVLPLGKAALKIALNHLQKWAEEEAKAVREEESVQLLVHFDDGSTTGTSHSVRIRKGAVFGLEVVLKYADDLLSKV